MNSKEWYLKRYIPTLQAISMLLIIAWGACLVGATIWGASNGAISVDYTPYTPLLVWGASVGGVYSVSVLVGIACRW